MHLWVNLEKKILCKKMGGNICLAQDIRDKCIIPNKSTILILVMHDYRNFVHFTAPRIVKIAVTKTMCQFHQRSTKNSFYAHSNLTAQKRLTT
jgi:hypothetical protein